MGYKPNLILSSRQINNGMSAYVAKKDNSIIGRGG